MAYEQPSPQEKLAFLRHLGFKIGSRVELGFNWLGGYETENVFYQGVSTGGEFLGSLEPRSVPEKYPVSSTVSYKIID